MSHWDDAPLTKIIEGVHAGTLPASDLEAFLAEIDDTAIGSPMQLPGDLVEMVQEIADSYELEPWDDYNEDTHGSAAWAISVLRLASPRYASSAEAA